MRTQLIVALALAISVSGCSSKKKSQTDGVEKASTAESNEPASPVDTVEEGTLLLPQGLKHRTELNLRKGIVTAFGEEYAASEFCSSETINDPRTIRIFRVRGSADVLAYHCPGATNVTTLFRRNKPPRTQHHKTAPGAGEMSAAEVEKVIRELLKSPDKTFEG